MDWPLCFDMILRCKSSPNAMPTRASAVCFAKPAPWVGLDF
jgi:hypothetical protein